MSGDKSQSGATPGAGGDPSMEDILASIRRILSEEDLPVGAPPAPPPMVDAKGPDILILDETMLVADAPPEPAARPLVPPPVVPEPVLVSPSEPEPEPVPEPEPEPEPIVAHVPPEPAPPEPAPPEPAPLEPAPLAAVAMEPPPVWEPDPEATIPLPEPVRTETPMPSDSMPPLTPETAEPPIPPPFAPVLVPVPTGAPPPSFRRPAPIVPPIEAFQIEPPHAETSPPTESSPMSSTVFSQAGGLASAETANATAGSVTNLVRALTSDRAQVFSGGPTIADLVREEIRPLLKEWLDANLPPLVERLVRAEIERVISRVSG